MHRRISVFLALTLPAFAVEFTTLQNKVLFGYQGWFDCPNGGSGSWVHWAKGSPTATNLTVDMYPDLSEFNTADLCAAGAMTSGGKTSYLFPSRNAAIINAHFTWMEQFGLDGVLVQRFIGEAPGKRSSGDVVLKNIMTAAVAHGRTFAIEYDLSGGSEATFAQAVQTDWMYLVDSLKVTANPNYLHHNGKPVVSVWGPGLNDGHVPKTPAPLATFIQWFKSTAAAKYQAVYIGGTPSGWRTLDADALTDPAWTPVYKSMDVVQPWTVGRYIDTTTATNWKSTHITPDLAATNTAGNLYMPVIFPGFSWYNLNMTNSTGIKNQIPRKGGYFIWKQAYNAKAAGASMLKIAMFDEVDEGTAMFKVASLRSQAPDQGYWLTLDADGYNLPSDWYLRLAQKITEMFHGTLPPTPTMPLDPAHPVNVFANPGRKVHARLRVNRVEGGVFFESLTEDAASLRIFTPGGKFLRALILRNNRAFWDERDAAGNALSPGIYFLKVTSPSTRFVEPFSITR